MSGTQLLKMLVNERLAAAAEDIFVLFERTILKYQDEVVRSRREIHQLKQQIEQLSDLKSGGKLFKADTQIVTEELLPSLQYCDLKEEQIPVLVETEIQERPQVKEEQEDECISPDIEADTVIHAELRLHESEPTTPVLKSRETANSAVPNEWTAPLSFSDTLHTQPLQPGPSLMKAQNSWISKLEIPWDKLPASLLQAITRGTKACPSDKRAMVRAVVSAMQEHCPNPNKAACIEVAKMILSKYPVTFADATAEGGLFGKSFFTLVYKLKRRIENVNRYSKCKRK